MCSHYTMHPSCFIFIHFAGRHQVVSNSSQLIPIWRWDFSTRTYQSINSKQYCLFFVNEATLLKINCSLCWLATIFAVRVMFDFWRVGGVGETSLIFQGLGENTTFLATGSRVFKKAYKTQGLRLGCNTTYTFALNSALLPSKQTCTGWYYTSRHPK